MAEKAKDKVLFRKSSLSPPGAVMIHCAFEVMRVLVILPGLGLKYREPKFHEILTFACIQKDN